MIRFAVHFVGEVIGERKLYSTSIIPKRTLDKIDHLTTSGIETGFLHFHYKHLVYREQLTYAMKVAMYSDKALNDGDEVELQSINGDQFKTPMIILLFLNGIATIIFVAEILVSKWLKWRSCMYYKHNFSYLQ